MRRRDEWWVQARPGDNPSIREVESGGFNQGCRQSERQLTKDGVSASGN